MRTFYYVAAALLFAGCLTEKKRSDVFHRYAREHRSELLEYCPVPTETFVPGRVDTVTLTDTVRIRVPYPVPGTNDTIWVECPQTETFTRYVTRVDTLYRDNRIELLKLSDRLSETEKQLGYSNGERDTLKSERNRWRNTAYILIGSIVIVIVVRIWLKIKIPF